MLLSARSSCAFRGSEVRGSEGRQDSPLAVLADPQGHGCLGQRLLQEQHPHHKGLGQGGQLSEDTQAAAGLSPGGRHSQAQGRAGLPVDRQTCGWMVVESVQNLRTQLPEVLVQVLALQLHVQLHRQPWEGAAGVPGPGHEGRGVGSAGPTAANPAAANTPSPRAPSRTKTPGFDAWKQAFQWSPLLLWSLS